MAGRYGGTKTIRGSSPSPSNSQIGPEEGSVTLKTALPFIRASWVGAQLQGVIVTALVGKSIVAMFREVVLATRTRLPSFDTATAEGLEMPCNSAARRVLSPAPAGSLTR